MSEDTKSAAIKSNRRFLYVANPGSDESSGEEDNHPDDSNLSGFSYQPPPLQPRSARPIPPHYAPSPLTTNLPNQYRSSRSNSSPSSTSSPAVESTPPPSTPSINAPPSDLSGDPSIRQEPLLMGPNVSERGDGVHVTVRPTGFFEKIKAHLPRPSHQTRPSGNCPLPNTVRSYITPMYPN